MGQWKMDLLVFRLHQLQNNVSQTISLNQIPDKLIIYVCKQSQTWSDTDCFLPTSWINVNWNNNTGVCSSFKQSDLWRCSVEAGSNQTFDEFRGFAQIASEGQEKGVGGGTATKKN